MQGSSMECIILTEREDACMSVKGRDHTPEVLLAAAIAVIWTVAFWLGFTVAILVGAV